MRRRWLAIGVIAGAVAMIAGGAYAAGGTGQSLNLNSGGSITVTCPNTDTLGIGNQQPDSVDVGCTVNPPVTTTTVAPTTTTVPVTTTTPPPPPPPPPPSGCPAFLEAPSSPQAFCDTLGTPAPTAGTRSGQLNGVLWGVSRSTQNTNINQGSDYSWAASQQNQCGTTVRVQPDNDVNMCNGQLVESMADAGGSGELAMYPRQPFDFANRTGTVEFNVSDDTEGSHAAWPDLIITDQPIPAPGEGESQCGGFPAGCFFDTQPGINDFARNSVAVSFVGAQGGQTCVHAHVYAIANYQPEATNWNEDSCATIPGTGDSPAGLPTQLNHVEVQINSGGVQVFMSNPNDPSGTKLITDASFPVPLTRGLVWLVDDHYNGCKFNDQCDHTFGWSDLAFDGPVLPRDLGFDVPDASPTNLGYVIPQTGSLSVSTSNPVTAGNIAAASGALVEFNYWPTSTGQTFTVSVDGGMPVQMAMPNVPAWGSETLAIPVPVTDLKPGTQSISISTSDPNGDASANYDLILQGAGG